MTQQEMVTTGFDLPRIEAAVREILIALGEDPDRDGLMETPERVARAGHPHHADPRRPLGGGDRRDRDLLYG